MAGGAHPRAESDSMLMWHCGTHGVGAGLVGPGTRCEFRRNPRACWCVCVLCGLGRSAHGRGTGWSRRSGSSASSCSASSSHARRCRTSAHAPSRARPALRPLLLRSFAIACTIAPAARTACVGARNRSSHASFCVCACFPRPLSLACLPRPLDCRLAAEQEGRFAVRAVPAV